jgi:hypothetical protein
VNSNPVDTTTAGALDMFKRNTVIEHVVAVTADPRSDYTLVVDVLAISVWHSVVARPVAVEMIPGHKAVTTRTQTKTETHAN